MMKEKPKDNKEVTRDDCEEEEEEGEEVGKGDNSAAKTPVSLLQVDKLFCRPGIMSFSCYMKDSLYCSTRSSMSGEG